MKKIIYSFAAVLAFVISPFDGSAQTSASPDSVKKAIIKVVNLHCNNDMPTIKKQLLNQDGIDEVLFTDISGTLSTFTVSYHSSVINQEQIEKSIEGTPGCDDKNERPYKVRKETPRKTKK
ncbi:MAG: heavy-metal-associated domain-containing protein [Taibaiella sp.]|nr:heavy-metal-associated domain-containing protein [Taibaiella sp.]